MIGNVNVPGALAADIASIRSTAEQALEIAQQSSGSSGILKPIIIGSNPQYGDDILIVVANLNPTNGNSYTFYPSTTLFMYLPESYQISSNSYGEDYERPDNQGRAVYIFIKKTIDYKNFMIYYSNQYRYNDGNIMHYNYRAVPNIEYVMNTITKNLLLADYPQFFSNYYAITNNISQYTFWWETTNSALAAFFKLS